MWEIPLLYRPSPSSPATEGRSWIPGTFHQEEDKGMSQDTKEGLCLSTPGAPQASLCEAGGGVWGEGSLRVSAKSAATATRPPIIQNTYFKKFFFKVSFLSSIFLHFQKVFFGTLMVQNSLHTKEVKCYHLQVFLIVRTNFSCCVCVQRCLRGS